MNQSKKVLERLFSSDYQGSTAEFDDDLNTILDTDKSKAQLLFNDNEAFLTLAWVEGQTIPSSLDILDQCMINKLDLFNAINYYEDDALADKRVVFSEIKDIHSISTISESSEPTDSCGTPSPLLYNDYSNYVDKSMLGLDGSSSDDITSSESSEEEITDDNSSVEILDNCSLASTPTPSPTTFHEKAQFDLNDDIILSSFKFDEHDLVKSNVKINAEDIVMANNSYQFVTQSSSSLTSIQETQESNMLPPMLPPLKSILKKRIIRPSPSSEPIARRHTLANNIPYRDCRSVQSVGSYNRGSPLANFRPKRVSAPAKLPLRKLRLSLKVNKVFLESLKQSQRDTDDLVELLLKQAETLNQEIHHVILYNTALCGGAVLGVATAVVLTCLSVTYCCKSSNSCTSP